MERKFWSNCFGAFLVASMFTGCSSDNFTGQEPGGYPVDPQDVVYMNITMQLPDARGGRSETNSGPDGGSTGGVEIGKDNENKINEVMMVFTKSDYEIIAYGSQESTTEISSTGKVTSVQKIGKSELAAYYGTDNVLTEDEQKVNVILLANATQYIKDKIREAYTGKLTTWIDEVCSIEETSVTSLGGFSNNNSAIWGGDRHQGGFMMTSAQIETRTLPRDFSDWEHHSSADKAFNLSGVNHANTDKVIDNSGAIKIERSVARFDFRDGSALGNNTYTVVTETGDDNVTKTVLQVQLQKMALVNMSKNFYFFRRVSDDGLSDGAIVGGMETDANYVVDTDASDKNNENFITNRTYAANFNFGLHHIVGTTATIDEYARNQWFTSNISDVLAGENDNYAGWTGTEKPATDLGYRIWRYVTENTIPGPVDRQIAGITTGVVFKAKMIVPENSESTIAEAIKNVTGVSQNDAILYVHGSNIYVRWTEVREAALKAGTGSDFYRQAFGTPTNTPSDTEYSDDPESADYLWNAWYIKDKTNNSARLAFKAAAKKAEFTIYESSKDDDNEPGYYCYYFYWNRHNDNGNNGVMGQMEFGVVRNNVYKLAVKNIRRLGHPRISDNDPDPIIPETPDEKGDVYFDVEVEAVPWVVRVNDIDF